jgi:hypothetical protein
MKRRSFLGGMLGLALAGCRSAKFLDPYAHPPRSANRWVGSPVNRWSAGTGESGLSRVGRQTDLAGPAGPE